MSGRPSELWRCSICGTVHTGLATIFGPHFPEAWRRASPAQREAGLIGPELCSIDDATGLHHFVRGHLPLPVDDEILNPFVWSVWVEVDAAAMSQIVELWEAPERWSEQPYAGVLATDLPYAQSTMGLAVTLQTRPLGRVPMVRLQPNFEHELVHEQYEGITVHRVAEINRTIME